MAVSPETPIATSIANGVAVFFSFAFTILDDGDLVVTGTTGGVTTPYVLGVDYTVTGLGVNPGSINFVLAPANGVVVTMFRRSALGREITYQTLGDLLAVTLNLDIDRLWYAMQEISARTSGSIRLPYPEQTAELPPASQRTGGYLLGFDTVTGAVLLVLAAAGTAVALALSLASSIGSSLVGFLQRGLGAIARTLQDKNRERVSITDFMTAAQIADAQSSAALDVLGRASLLAAIAALSPRGGVVEIPDNLMIPISDTVALGNGIRIKGAGSYASRVKYTKSSGIMFDMYGTTAAGVSGLRAVTDAGGTCQFARIYGNQNQVVDCILDELTPGSGTGWGVFCTIEPDVTLQARSSSNIISDVYLNAVRTSGLTISRSVDTFIDKLRSFGIQDNTTYQHIIIETGASGVYLDRVSLAYGLHGMVHRHSFSIGTGPYNQAPLYIFADQVLADTMTGGDGFYFDASLGSSTVNAKYTNSWSAGCGKKKDNTTITALARGVGVYGGQGYRLDMRARANCGSGAAVNSANVANITFTGDYTSNNQANNADEHGVYAIACGEQFHVKEARCGNTLDGGGHQKYGIKVAAGIGVSGSIVGCDLKDNETAPRLLSTTRIACVGNTPDDTTQDTVIGGRIMLGDNAFMFGQQSAALAAAGTVALNYAVNRGKLTVTDNTDGGAADFIIDAAVGGVRLGGNANVVAGAPGASQIGVNVTTGAVTNGYAAARNVSAIYSGM